MEPITHLMTGACLSRAGLNRKAAYATLTMVLAAEMPDLDVLWSVDGPVAAFAHHRGITHTFVGVPVEAAILVGAVWCVHRVRLRRAARQESSGSERKPLTAAPVRWGILYLLALLALLSHLLLDYTNNYGLRPFFPFNPRWHAGSIVFIFEPVLFLILLAGLTFPALFGLINSEVGARKPAFRPTGWAIAALLGTLALWTWRTVEQQKALQLAATIDISAAQPPGSPALPILRMSASPYPGNPYRWHMVVDTPDFYQLATADTLRGVLADPQLSDVVYKPQTTLATLAAKRSPLGEAYLDWSSYPIVTDTTPLTQNPADPHSISTVTFRDARFMYDVLFMKGRTNPPLTGVVEIDANRQVVSMAMDSRKK